VTEQETELIGHHQARDSIIDAVDPASGTRVIIVSGGVGAGKTALLRWLHGRVGDTIDVPETARSRGISLRTDRSSVSAVVARLAAAVTAGSTPQVAVYDDIDNDLDPATVPLFVRDLVQSLDLTAVVLTMKTQPSREVYPVPVEVFSLERREATRPEFERFLDTVLRRAGRDLDVISAELVTTLFQLQSQCSDFRAVKYVVSALAARSGRDQIDESDLYRLLRQEREITGFRAFPGVSVTANGRIIFRAKDKTEELCEMIVKYYDDPTELALIAADGLPGFDAPGFLRESRRSYRDAVMALCLVQSPLDLITSLFGPRDIIREIERRRLDKAREFDSPGARARLLVRGLGFTLGDDPVGIPFYRQAVASARALVEADRTPPEALRGSGLSLLQTTERMLFDLIHFWGSLLFGSISHLVQSYNSRGAGRRLRAQRLTSGEMAALLRYLNHEDGEVRYSVSLLLTERRQPLSNRFLTAVDGFVRVRNEFIHEIQVQDDRGKALLGTLLTQAEDVVESGAESYPAVVKLCEIVFDEFGRRIYSAVDTDDRRLRFALTRENEGGGVSISSHYFMAPAQPVTVDPVLVPRTPTDSSVLFHEGESYARSSETQRAQSTRLLARINLAGREQVLDVGCGDGRVTIEIWSRFPGVRVHGIDISVEMVKIATITARDHGADTVTFEEADLLNYEPGRAFDVVFSNSAMHWVLPPEAAYRALFRLLAPGGTLAVHQGGEATYVGLRTCALEVIKMLGLTAHFAGWSYPAFYPTRAQLADLLRTTGFVNVQVESHESDGHEHPSLIRDFAHAGLLPFLRRVPADKRELLRNEFLRHAARSRPSLYQHRLYATGRRP
jgi:trans-aconitate methyltransferase